MKYKYVILILMFNIFYVFFTTTESTPNSELTSFDISTMFIFYILVNFFILVVYFLLFSKEIKRSASYKVDKNLILIIIQIFLTTSLVELFLPISVFVLATSLMIFFLQYYYVATQIIRKGQDIGDVIIPAIELYGVFLLVFLADITQPYGMFFIFILFLISLFMILKIYYKNKTESLHEII